MTFRKRQVSRIAEMYYMVGMASITFNLCIADAFEDFIIYKVASKLLSHLTSLYVFAIRHQ
jgi:hypothetical protein